MKTLNERATTAKESAINYLIGPVLEHEPEFKIIAIKAAMSAMFEFGRLFEQEERDKLIQTPTPPLALKK